MAVDLDDKLDAPTIHKLVRESVGTFMFAWGILERELDTSFHVLFHTDPTLASCIYANLGTKAKLDILSSAISMLATRLGPRLARGAHSRIDKVRDLSDKARNTLAHGQIHVFADLAAGTQHWEIVRHVARKSHSIVIHPQNPGYWETQARIALRLAQQWRTLVAKMNRKIGEPTLKDLRQICSTPMREGERSYAYRRKRPPRQKPDWWDHRATLSTWPRKPP
jgi:hypothetical protein